MAIKMTEIAKLLAQRTPEKPDAAPPDPPPDMAFVESTAAQIAASALLTGIARQAIIAAAADAVAQLTGASLTGGSGALPPIAPAKSANTVKPGGGTGEDPSRVVPESGSGTGP